MLKKILLILTFSLISINFSQGQVLISLIFGDKLNSDKLEFGLDGGFNWSTISSLEEANLKRGFHLGFYFDIKLQEKLFIHTGVIVKSPMGTEGLHPYSLGDDDLDSVLLESSVSRKLRYFNVPILLMYRFYGPLFVELGPQLGLLSKATDEFTQDVFDKNDLLFINNIRDDYRRIDAGLTGGLGYKFDKGPGIKFGVRYYLGLTEILKENPGDPQKNRSLYLYASIPIGSGKAKAKREESLNESQ
jgi:hypothetical protein